MRVDITITDEVSIKRQLGIKRRLGVKYGLRIRYETKYNKTRSALAQVRISKTRPWVLLLRVKILLSTHRRQSGLQKVRVEILSQNCTLFHEFSTRGGAKNVMGKKGNILGINFNFLYMFKSSDWSVS